MPVYVYKILETGETFEYEQRISDDALTEHPETGQAVRRVIQPVGIAFRGSGFYVNDSRASSNGAARGAAKPAGDGGTSGSAGSGAADGGSTGSGGAADSAAAGATKSTGEAAASSGSATV